MMIGRATCTVAHDSDEVELCEEDVIVHICEIGFTKRMMAGPHRLEKREQRAANAEVRSIGCCAEMEVIVNALGWALPGAKYPQLPEAVCKAVAGAGI